VSGANGSIGIARAARAAPDGYTIPIGQWDTVVVNAAVYALSYDPVNAFEPVAPIVSTPIILYARKGFPANDLRELIAWLKVNPDKATQAANTTGLHAFGAMFQKETGTRVRFVPYRGGAPAMQDLLAGQIDLMWSTGIYLPQAHAGSIKAYTVTAATRVAAAPEIPTVGEIGLPQLSFSNWWGLFVPKGTPKMIIGKLHSAVVEALADQQVRSRFADIQAEIFPRDQQTPEALAALQKADIEKWWPIIKAASIKAE
jgi:tripartite-type tricarboxylate transporter receptor subunit TctC